MEEGILINFTPGKLIFRPPGGDMGSNYSYMYLEGNIAFTPDGVFLQGAGTAVEILPWSVDGKPGGAFVMQSSVVKNIPRQIFFAGEAKIALTGRRLLLIQCLPGGKFQFFVGQNNGVGVELRATNINDLKVHQKSHPVKLKK